MAEPPAYASGGFGPQFQTSGQTSAGGSGSSSSRPRGLFTRTLRQICIEVDSGFIEGSLVDIEYEFGGGRRIFKGRYQHRGPYGDT